MIRLALMGDLHFPILKGSTSKLVEARDHFFDSYLQAFFGISADMYISIGDLTHQGLAREFQHVYQYIREHQAHFRLVLGNHDTLSLPKEDILSTIGQSRYGLVEKEEALLLFLDTTKEMNLHGWGLDEEQWIWLEKQVELSEDKPMLIFAHHPVPGTTIDSPADSTEYSNYKDVRPILAQKRGIGIFFNGHTHTHSIAVKQQWYFIQTPASLCNPCFRVVEIDSKQIRILTTSLDDIDIDHSRQILHDRLPEFHRPRVAIHNPDTLYSPIVVTR